MATETPEQVAAQRELDAAVDRYMEIRGWQGLITHYVTVAHLMLPPNDEGEEGGTYAMVYRGGQAPDHIVEGLLQMGIRRLRGEGIEETGQ